MRRVGIGNGAGWAKLCPQFEQSLNTAFEETCIWEFKSAGFIMHETLSPPSNGKWRPYGARWHYSKQSSRNNIFGEGENRTGAARIIDTDPYHPPFFSPYYRCSCDPRTLRLFHLSHLHTKNTKSIIKFHAWFQNTAKNKQHCLVIYQIHQEPGKSHTNIRSSTARLHERNTSRSVWGEGPAGFDSAWAGYVEMRRKLLFCLEGRQEGLREPSFVRQWRERQYWGKGFPPPPAATRRKTLRGPFFSCDVCWASVISIVVIFIYTLFYIFISFLYYNFFRKDNIY